MISWRWLLSASVLLGRLTLAQDGGMQPFVMVDSEFTAPLDFDGGVFGSLKGGLGLKGTSGVDASVVTGSLDKEVIRRVIKTHVGSIRGCYQRVVEKNLKLEAKVVMRFVIGSKGAVSDAVISETGMNDAKLVDCLVGW